MIKYLVLYYWLLKEVYMKLIVGLGNPGVKYNKTRHNCGFEAIDILANKLGIEINQNKFKSLIAITKVNGEQVILMKPQTYMNLSGEAVLQAVNFYKIKTEDIIILHDDLDLPIGNIRIRMSGSAGGQKGMKNIIDLLHTQDIARIRIGIDKNPNIPVVDYVLGKLDKDKQDLYENAFNKSADAAYAFISKPIMKVMNEFN